MIHTSSTTLCLAFAAALVFACASTPKSKTAPGADDDVPLGAPLSFSTPTDGAPSARGESAGGGCIVVQGDFAPQPTTVDGVLAKTTGRAAAPFVLRLIRPRCIVGLERSSVLTEVYVASTAADLRPLVDARLRITGDAIAGTNDLGGPAVILLAKDFERLAPPADP
jgi:hypothetical protein